jgi:nucleoid-associated protein YgaU
MISLQQPRPNDIVGSRVLIAGLATGYEATIHARVRNANGQQLASDHFMSGGGAGEIGQFQTVINLPERPDTPGGFVEVFSENAGYPDEGPYDGPVAELDKVIVPVVFGTHLQESYLGYTFHVVVDGESLSAIAADEYEDASMWPAIYEANRDQIGDPDLIFSGQRLRIPH